MYVILLGRTVQSIFGNLRPEQFSRNLLPKTFRFGWIIQVLVTEDPRLKLFQIQCRQSFDELNRG